MSNSTLIFTINFDVVLIVYYIPNLTNLTAVALP